MLELDNMDQVIQFGQACFYRGVLAGLCVAILMVSTATAIWSLSL